MLKKQLEKTVWEFEDVKIAVKIYREARRNVRASIRQSGVIIRMPIFLSSSEEEKQIAHFKQWAKEQLAKSDKLKQRLKNREYHDGMELQVGSKTYTIWIEESNLKSHKAKIEDGQIYLKLTKYQRN